MLASAGSVADSILPVTVACPSLSGKSHATPEGADVASSLHTRESHTVRRGDHRYDKPFESYRINLTPNRPNEQTPFHILSAWIELLRGEGQIGSR